MSSILDWAVSARTLRGEAVSGDLHVLLPFEGGVLAAVIDGLGHGPEAAFAARTAGSLLAENPAASVDALVQRCHAGLRKTRGVVLSLASFRISAAEMTWLGVGDVEGVLLRADPSTTPPRETILLRGGVVGYQLPTLRASSHRVLVGDLLILATDGVRHGFLNRQTDDDEAPDVIADAILADHGKTTDDALVLVARYRGAG